MSTEKHAGEAATSTTTSFSPPSEPLTSGKIPDLAQFLDKGKEATRARRIYINILVGRICLIFAAVFAVFSIYWGALLRMPARSLEGWIIDFDGDAIGQFVTEELSALSGPDISWRIQRPGNGLEDLDGVARAILDEKCWIAVAISPGATRALNESLILNNASLNSSNFITAYGIEARNENAYRVLLRPTVDESLNKIAHNFAFKRMSDYLRSNASIENVSPEILVRPIYYTLQNVRPFDIPVATAATFIGLIYLLILAFIMVNVGTLARGVSGLERKLSTASLIRIRLLSPILIYLVLTLAYSLLNAAFKLPFDRHLGRAGFFVFWMLSWFGMTAAGLALESMITLLTIKFIQVFLILWIIGNVAVCLWPIDALPVIYRYGHAAPFYNISRGVRTIVFGTKNELGLNFGVLGVWIVISCFTLPLFQWYQRRGNR